MPPPNSRKSRLKRAKQTGYRGSSESTWSCIARLLAFAARTALIVFLIRSVILQDFPFMESSSSKSDGGGAAKEKATTQPTTRPPKDTPQNSSPPPNAPDTPKQGPPPPSGTLREWEWKGSPTDDPLQFSKATQLQPYKHILLLGDSTYSPLAGATQHNWIQTFTSAAPAAKAYPCTLVEYLNLQRAPSFVPPDHSLGEGPVTQKRPFCNECNGCKSGKQDSGLGNPYAWEYINVDYARDVSNPSTKSKTTQEAIELYLKSRFSTARLCVATVGLQDMLIPGITKELYLKNLQDFLSKLAPHCHSMVWISMGATQIQPATDVKLPQSNAQIELWNTETKAMFAKDPTLASKLIYLDVYKASKVYPHQDAIHMTAEWYRALAKLWVSPLAEFAKK